MYLGLQQSITNTPKRLLTFSAGLQLIAVFRPALDPENLLNPGKGCQIKNNQILAWLCAALYTSPEMNPLASILYASLRARQNRTALDGLEHVFDDRFAREQ